MKLRTPKDNCILCLENLADKKGSHIVPHFLLKRFENVNEKNERDYELGFEISGLTNKFHFGRNVPIENLEEILGDVTDDDIQKNKHPLIADYIFCNYCEERLAKIENEYAKSIRIERTKKTQPRCSSELGLLFWGSILWRISINNKNGIRLTSNQNETIRRILNRTLNINILDVDFGGMKDYKDVAKISYKLLRCPNFDERETLFVIHTDFRSPYSMAVADYVVFFSFNSNYNDFLEKDFFGIQQEVFNAEANRVGKQESLCELENSIYERFRDSSLERKAKDYIAKVHNILDKIHINLGGQGKKMPEHLKYQIIEKLNHEEKKLGRKYGLDSLQQITVEVLMLNQQYY